MGNPYLHHYSACSSYYQKWKESKVANSRKDQKDSLVNLLTRVLFSKSLSTQMLIVSSNGIFVI